MHYVIIEDLESDREHLSGLIREDCFSCGEDIHLSSYSDGETFLADFRPGFCSAVFVDIILGDGKLDGIQTARQIREIDRRLPIIFTTTEEGYALAGYKVHPLDYLTKPVCREDVSWCLQELREYLAKPAWFEVPASRGQGAAPVSLHVFLDDFLYAETTGPHRLTVHTVSEVIPTRLSLSEFSALLPGGGRFPVTGQGSLINLSQVARIQPDGEILFLDGHRFFCSRRKIKETQAAFSRYLASTPRSVPAAKRFAAKHGIKTEAPVPDENPCSDAGDSTQKGDV